MPNVLALVAGFVFSGVPSNAAWDAIKHAWERISGRDWEDLFLDSFEEVVENERSRLAKYAGSDGEIRIDRAELQAALHYDLGAPIPMMTIQELTQEEFGEAVSDALVEREALILGGHTLTKDDYASIITGLVRKSKALFRQSVLRKQSAFQQAILDQLVDNTSLANETLAFVEDRFSLILARLDEHSAQLEKISADTSTISEVLQGLTGSPGYVIVHPIPSPDSPPLAPEAYVKRPLLIQNLLAKLSEVTLLAISDSPGKGKTQVVRELITAHEYQRVWWISLHETRADYRRYLREQLVRWLIDLTGEDRYWGLYTRGRLMIRELAQAIERVSGDALLILDNLPNPVNEAFYAELLLFTSYFSSQRVRLLTTSQWPLSATIAAEPTVVARSLPDFTAEEVRQVLLRYGASERFATDGLIGLILANTGGNPSLVQAVASWLRRSGWRLDDLTFSELLSGQPADEVRRQVRPGFLQLLDSEPRTLLHRLTLIDDTFDRDLALRIGSAPPALEFPGDAFDQLTSPWLEKLEGEEYRVSPMFKGSGAENLTDEVQKKIHLLLADHLLAADTISLSQITNIAPHLLAAGEHERFAGFLIHAMISANTPERAKYLDQLTAITHYYASAAWPEAVSLDYRIMFRAAQVRLRMLMKEQYSELNADLNVMLAEVNEKNVKSVIFALLNTGPLLGIELPHQETIPAVRKAIQAMRILHQTNILQVSDDRFHYEDLIWIPVWSMDHESQLEDFLEELRQLSQIELTRFFASKIALESTLQVADKRWMLEADKLQEDQNWQEVLAYLDKLKEIGQQIDAQMPEVVIARSRALVLADYLGETDAALAVLNGFSNLDDSPSLSFLVYYTRGCIHHDNERYENALDELNAANAVFDDSSWFYVFDAQRRSAVILSHLGRWNDAKSRCIEAIHTADRMGLDIARLEMIGELAWIHWSMGDKKRAAASIFAYADGLVSYSDVSEPSYREAFLKLGHGAAWFLSVAKFGEPPKLTRDGGPYAPVVAGLFGLPRRQLRDFQPLFGFSQSSLLMIAALFAYAVGLDRLAWQAYTRTKSVSRTNVDKRLTSIGDFDFATLTARFGEFASAIRLAIETIRELAALSSQPLPNLPTLEVFDIDVEQLWLQLPPKERMQHERRLLQLVFAPAFLELLLSGYSLELLTTKLSTWKSVIDGNVNRLEEPQYWQEVIGFLERLLTGNESEVPNRSSVPGGHPLLMILWYLIASTRKGIRLQDSLSMQVSAVLPFVERPDVGRPLFLQMGSFLHRYWSTVASQRGFALNSPILFREELARINRNEGTKTIVAVLFSASRATGASLPTDVARQLRDLEKVSAPEPEE